MKSLRSWILCLGLGVLFPLVAPVAKAADSAHQPKVSLVEARTRALAIVPGAVVAEELEREGGRWIYSFEIRPTGEKRKIVREVNIDADTGVVVGVETEKG